MKKIALILTSLLLLFTCVVLWTACDVSNAPSNDTEGGTFAVTQAVTEAGVEETEQATQELQTIASTEEGTIVEDVTVAQEAVTEVATEVATKAETEPVTEAETEAETQLPQAGTDSGIVRDGTPKKYITFRFDDGITQDARILEIFKKYDVDGATFYINTGLYGANWTWVGQTLKKPDLSHVRYTEAELRSGIYDGFELGVHTLNHPSLKDCGTRKVTDEVQKDAENIAAITGYMPVGMAWPGGDTEFNERNIKTILSTTDIRYGSCTTRNTAKGLGKFSLPEYFMTWYPTCSLSDGDALTLLQEFIAADPTEDMLFFAWCHGYEFDFYNSWDRFELFVSTLAGAAAIDDSIVIVTNAEFYQLFKDEIPAWKE